MTDIGSTLREARMRERIDISEVESQTKIRAKYLRAIENEEWDLLPGPVYAKSFLRTYGDYLGLDSRMLLDEFRHRYEHPSDQEIRPVGSIAARERDRDRRPQPRRLPSWALIGVVVVALLAVLYFVGRSNQASTTSSTPTHAARPKRHPRATPTTRVAPVVPTTATLKLVPTGAVYVCLVNGQGTKLINEQTYSAGQVIPTQHGGKLLLTLGNASVQMKVNGKAVPVTPSPTAIRLMITPTSVRPVPISQTPTCP